VAADADLIYRWRNAPATRRYFFDPRPLEAASHDDWYARLLADPDRILLIGLDENRLVGAIRYDIQGEAADISVFLDPEARGRGYGARLIRAGSGWLAANRPGLRRLDARIHPDNRASLAAFAAAGFTEHDRHYQCML
jgi:RimJ/RimL family protein N-acetyltransferase